MFSNPDIKPNKFVLIILARKIRTRRATGSQSLNVRGGYAQNLELSHFSNLKRNSEEY